MALQDLPLPRQATRQIYISTGHDGFLGGAPPRGIRPESPTNRFFATVRTSQTDTWLSIFVEADYTRLLDSLQWLRVSDLPSTIELIEHEGKIVREAADSRYRSELSAHTLRLGDAISDLATGSPLSRSKLGGEPECIQMGSTTAADLGRARTVTLFTSCNSLSLVGRVRKRLMGTGRLEIGRSVSFGEGQRPARPPGGSSTEDSEMETR